MPYVEVWVDEDTCHGDCREAKAAEAQVATLEAAIGEALSLFAGGEPDAAFETLKYLPSEAERQCHQREEALLQGLWLKWQDSPLPRQPFIEWAHGRRLKTNHRSAL